MDDFYHPSFPPIPHYHPAFRSTPLRSAPYPVLTGKTDVAVQVISNLYHSFPNQRTIMVAHSNAALNDLFEKIMEK